MRRDPARRRRICGGSHSRPSTTGSSRRATTGRRSISTTVPRHVDKQDRSVTGTEDDEPMPSGPRIAQTLDRGLEILLLLSHQPEGRPTSELADLLGVHRSIAHRLLVTLERRGLVAKNSNGTFSLGLGLVGLAAGVRADLRSVVRPYLAELAQTTGETVHLVVRDGHDVVFIDGIESPKTVRVSTRIGRRLPAHTTSAGKALLAELNPNEFNRWLTESTRDSLTARSIVDADALILEVAETAARAHAINREESEDLVGSVGVAVAVPLPFALSIAVPISRLDDAAIAQFATLLTDTRVRIEAEFGTTSDRM